LAASLHTLEEDVGQVRAEIGRRAKPLERQAKHTQAQLEELAQRDGKVGEEFEGLRKAIASAQAQIGQMKMDVTRLVQTEVEAAKTRLSVKPTKSREFENLSSQVEELQEEVQKLARGKSAKMPPTVQRSIDDLRSEMELGVESVKQDVALLQQAVNERIEALEGGPKKNGSIRPSGSAGREPQPAQVQDLVQRVGDCQRECAKMKREMKGILDEHSEAVERITAELDELRSAGNGDARGRKSSAAESARSKSKGSTK
jgi:archaellum component FlaC